MPLAARLSEAYAPGVVRTSSSNPAPGAEISQTVPVGQIWELMSVNFTLVTDATVANRQVTLVIDEGVNIVAQVTAQPLQAASLTYNYTFSVGGADRAAVVGNSVSVPLPGPLILPAGFRIRTSTLALAATDDFSTMFGLVVRYA